MFQPDRKQWIVICLTLLATAAYWVAYWVDVYGDRRGMFSGAGPAEPLTQTVIYLVVGGLLVWWLESRKRLDAGGRPPARRRSPDRVRRVPCPRVMLT